MLPISIFNKGVLNKAADALAHNDLPQPGMPTIKFLYFFVTREGYVKIRSVFVEFLGQMDIGRDDDDGRAERHGRQPWLCLRQ